ncbi:MAG: hypothetical protein ACE366_23685 [Bradymonadia bacterium]
MTMDRRTFAKRLAIGTGGLVLLPAVTGCGGAAEKAMGDAADMAGKAAGAAVPPVKPEGWDPIMYNKTRGNAGAIPKSYWPSINGADGDKKHLGKHLPYVPKLEAGMVPEGYVAIMWGDPEKGYAKHPNASKSDKNPTGHWYNWIKIRKAVVGEAEELQSSYSDWPAIGEGDNGKYVAFGGTDVSAEGGRNTIYLAALPKDVKPGDTVRVHAHCLTHGEYVDFITV